MLFTPSLEQPTCLAPAATAIGHSLVIPVYCNEENISDLIAALDQLEREISSFEVIFVIDGSPDRSAELLVEALANARFEWQLVELSRNFGSFAAVRQGLALARGQSMAVMAADLQEPPELIAQFFRQLDANTSDLVVGVRVARNDPVLNRLLARIYWWLYRRLIMRDIPAGGVDVFACNRAFRDALLTLEERNSFLIGQLFWLGFRRAEIPYTRQPRRAGKSAWKFHRRLRYMLDSVFAFSDLPISLLLWLGAIGLGVCGVLAGVTLIAWMTGNIDVRGYVPLMLVIMFFGSILILGQGILGCYLWRVSENSKRRPLSVILSHRVGAPAVSSLARDKE
jgi:glycosyltransferase involved in cell wall biosynthesis